MSERDTLAAQLKREEAMAKLLGLILPQGFSSDHIMTRDAPDSGLIDEWKLTKFSGRAMISLIYFQHRGASLENGGGGVRFYRQFTDLFLRGSHSIDGGGLKMLESIAIGLGGSGRSTRKTVKRPGWGGRNVTNRDWQRRATKEGSDVED